MVVHECVSFILIDGEQVLLEKRAQDKSSDPGMTAIPGGHIEPGETHVEALIRETGEELGVSIREFGYLCSLYHPTSEIQLLHYYVVTAWSGEIVSNEADEVFWSPLAGMAVESDADRKALDEYIRLRDEVRISFNHAI